MDNPEEQDYINRVKNGDAQSYRFIVDTYKHMVYTISIKILRNAEDAQDAAQESFIKAYQQIRQFEGKSKFSTWLYTIAYRTALSRLKENRIITSSITTSTNENYNEGNSIPQIEQLHQEDEQRYVRQAIHRLPEAEGLLITLYYINNNTVREIQEITGMSGANIKIKLFRARKKLERELKFLVAKEIKVIMENGN